MSAAAATKQRILAASIDEAIACNSRDRIEEVLEQVEDAASEAGVPPMVHFGPGATKLRDLLDRYDEEESESESELGSEGEQAFLNGIIGDSIEIDPVGTAAEPEISKADQDFIIKQLERVDFMRELKRTELQRIAAACQRQSFAAGETVFEQGDMGDYFYVIDSGKVAIVLQKGNITHQLAVLERGDFFGELALLNHKLRSASAIIDKSCGGATLISIDQLRFQQILKNHEQTIAADAVSHYQTYNKAKAHFANIALRKYDDIFHTDRIVEVLLNKDEEEAEEWRDEMATAAHPSVPLVRYVGAASIVFGVALNIFQISMAFRRSLPKQQMLYGNFTAGAISNQYADCTLAELEAEALGMEVDDMDEAINGCAKWETTVELALATGLVYAELGMWHVCWYLYNLFYVCIARTNLTTSKNCNYWVHVAQSVRWLEALATVSALKVLPKVKTMPVDAINSYKLMRKRLTEDDGEFSIWDKIYSASYLAMCFLTIIAASLAGVVALSLKVVGLKFLVNRAIGRWRRAEWIAFLGFANQIAGLVPQARVKKEALLFFIFTGVDAEMDTAEAEAMCEFNAQFVKVLANRWGKVRGYMLALTITDKDLQKFVLTEKRATRRAAISGVSGEDAAQAAMAAAAHFQAGNAPQSPPYIKDEAHRRKID